MTDTILIADDSESVRGVLRGQLEAAGYAVVEAGDGAEALRLCAVSPPQVVLLDVQMPVLDGHATLSLLKGDHKTRDIPVILLAAQTASVHAVAGLSLGAHDYLRKPCDAAELTARVAGALRTRAREIELRERINELETLSRTDRTTGLDNHYQIDRHLRASISAARRHGRTVGLLLIEVDNFADLHEGFRHGGGGPTLHVVAARLKSSLRVEDTVGRWSDTQFIAVLTETRTEGDRVVAERMRQLVAAAPFLLEDGTALTLTITIGFTNGADSGDSMISRAGAALLRAQADGHNRVEQAETVAAVKGQLSG